jgi:nucleoside-diphosphate-sugar epimerase
VPYDKPATRVASQRLGRRVLLTGASGFIGSRALELLYQRGCEVHAVSSRGHDSTSAALWHRADLLQAGAADALVEHVRPDWLLHLAWYTEHGRFWRSVENVRWVEATLRLLRAFADRGGDRAVVAGTCAEYEWSVKGGIFSVESTPLRPQTLYGISKDATRAVAEALADEVGFELAWGRIFSLYGPGEPETRLVPSVIRALLEGAPAAVSEGSQVRDFLHVNDVAEAFVALLDSRVRGPINVASGNGIAIRDVIKHIAAAAGRPDLIRFGSVATRSGEPAALVADVHQLRDEVGFRPRIPLDEGIARTVAWWQDRRGGKRE